MLTQNIGTRIKLNGATKLTGVWINNGIPVSATIAHPLGENIFIIAAFTESHLKMVKIRVTGETSFEWIDAKYTKLEQDEPGFPTECLSQSTFYEDCFQGNNVIEDN